MTLTGLPTPIDWPSDPEPARDPRWESVYATLEPVSDPWTGHVVTVHLTVGGRDLKWWTHVPWQDFLRVGSDWPRVLDSMVAGIHDSIGWADADRRAAKARIEAERAAAWASTTPPPSPLAAYDAAHDPFYGDH